MSQKKKAKLSERENRLLSRILRVDQAGEYGARRIYQGQRDVLKRRGGSKKTLEEIEHMATQEEKHLSAFNDEIAARQTRPSALQPLWHVAGYALGAATALLGEKAAHACTVAVEEVIEAHYARQEKELSAHPKLKAMVTRFRAEEKEHRETALAAGAEETPGYGLLKKAIGAGSRVAIWLAERF
ncbi:MAG: demethoxyubiquinone hydroxylase family protein [Proteobacteria bacterium]|nr:demethoxyubiquinone hydroxylase family protein [Pseudomonadota bacterium]